MVLASEARASSRFSSLRGEPPNMEASGKAYQTPIREPALPMAAGPEESTEIWSSLDQHYYHASFLFCSYGVKSEYKKKKKWPQTVFPSSH